MIEHDFEITSGDTDAIMFQKKDGSEFTPEEQESLIIELNSIMIEGIEFEHDGYYERLLVSKAKNYVTLEHGTGKLKKMGSSLKDSKKELALRELLDDLIQDIMYDGGNKLLEIYQRYVKEACDIKDISRWVTKKSISKAVLTGTRANETKVMDAVGDRPVQEGDKIFIFNDIDGMKQKVEKGELVFIKKTGEPKMVENNILRMEEDFTGSYDRGHYLKRVWSTMNILSNVLDMELFVKYQNTTQKKKLEELLND